MSNLEVLFWIAGAGAFGGFVDGLLFPRSYEFRIGHTKRDLGSFGDALVGATAAVAIFAVAGSVFAVHVGAMRETEEFLKVVAWGVLSGFAGLRVLRPLSDKLVMEVAGKAAREAVAKESVQAREAAVHILSGESLLTKYDFARSDPDWAETRKDEMQGFLDVAENKFKAALSADPGNPDAIRGVAKVIRRRADGVKDRDRGQWRKLMNDAIAKLTEVVQRNPGYAPGYYNRACYRALLEPVGHASALSDLAEALKLNPALRELAESDGDFAELRPIPEYRAIVGTIPASPGPKWGPAARQPDHRRGEKHRPGRRAPAAR